MKFFNAVVLWLVCITGMQAQISVVPTVKHLTSTSTPNAGTITLNVSGGTSPYSYTWTPGPVYTKDITNKAKNAYVVKVKDNAATTVTYTYNIGYKADWDQMYGCITRNDSLISDATYPWSQAITKNNLAASTNGWVEYILKGMSETKVFGMLDSLSPLPNTYTDIDYGYYYDGNLYEVVYGSLTNIVWGGYPEGTALRVERSGSIIKFVVNGVTIHTIADASAATKVWKVKGLIYGNAAGSSFVNMGCSFATKGGVTFKNYSNLVPYIMHSAGSGLTDGSIRVKPLKTGSYTYTWQPGSVTSATITSKAAGKYSLSAKDATNTITPKNYNIGYKVKWDQPYACQQKHDTLITTGFGSWGSAISKNTLSGGTDGWFEYVIRDMDQYKVIGFTDSLSPDVNNIYDIDYGFYYELGTLYYFGTPGYFIPVVSNIHEGTVLRVERRGDTIEHRFNGSLVSSSVYPGEGAKDWKVKGTVYAGMNSSLINVGCSFYTEGNSSFPNYTRLVPYVTHATGPASNDGGISVSAVQSGAYTYTWQPGATLGSSISSKAPGDYRVTVKDALNHQNSKSYIIGYKVKWDQLHACKLKHDTLVSDLSYSWGKAISKNTLYAGQDGWMEYVLKDLDQTRVFGFTDSLSPMVEAFTDIDYGFSYDGSNQRMYIYTNALNVIPVAINLPEGSILRIERKGDSILYKINNYLATSYIDSIAAQKNWKIKADVYSSNGSSMINVGCSFYQEGNVNFPNYTMLKPAIVHASNAGANDGSVKVKSENSGPLTYVWQPGSVHANPILNVSAGIYEVSVEDTLHHTNSNYYRVGYKTYWDSINGASVSGDTLKTTETYSWGRAVSKNTLAANTDGWFEYVLEDLDKIKVIGFLDSMSTNTQDIYDIDYGYYYDAVYGVLYTAVKGSFYPVGQGVTGSILRVERKADTILYTINGISLGNIVDTVDARKPWKIKGIVHAWAGTKLVNVGCSFGFDNGLSVYPIVTNYINDTLKGTVSLNVTGGYAPYNIAWNNVRLPSSTVAYHALLSMGYPAGADSTILKHQFDSIRQNTMLSGLMPGKYPVTIYDANNDSLKVVVVIGADMDTVLVKGLNVSHSASYKGTINGLVHLYGPGIDLQPSGGIVPGENLAVFSSVVAPLKTSLLEFNIPDTSSLAVGLTRIQDVIPYGTDDIKSKAAFTFEGNSYSVYVGNLLRYMGSYVAGDLFSISSNSTGALIFYRNDVEVYRTEFLSIATPDNEFLYKAVLNRANARLIKIKVIGPIGLAYGVSGTIKDVSCTNPCSGTIDAVGRGKFLGSPNRYELYAVSNPGTLLATVNTFPSGNHALFTNLCPGKYAVKFYYTYQELVLWGGTPVTNTGLLVGNFEIAYLPEWTNAVNVTISPNRSLTKTGGITDWDAGASTENFLKSTDNGWIEWISPSAESINAIGFNDVDQNLDITDIDYANGYFKINTGFLGIWKYFIKTHNSLMINSLFVNGNPMHPFVENQKFRLEKEVVAGVTSIKLFYNNVMADQFTGITATDYVADASLKQLLGTINNPRVSFGCGPSSTQYAVPKREADGGYYALDGVNLKFTLDGEYTLSTMKFKVQDRTRTIILSDVANGSLLNAVTTKPGDNRYILDCSSLIAGYYTLEVSNEKNEKLYLRFKR